MNPLDELLAQLSKDQAMPALVPSQPNQPFVGLAEKAAIGVSPEIQAAVWLYVDDLDRSHTISQGIESATGAYWHGIMHRREGDFSNAKYWFRRVGAHPVIGEIGYDPFEFIDDCASRHRDNPADLVEMQRREWQALFEWCKENAG